MFCFITNSVFHDCLHGHYCNIIRLFWLFVILEENDLLMQRVILTAGDFVLEMFYCLVVFLLCIVFRCNWNYHLWFMEKFVFQISAQFLMFLWFLSSVWKLCTFGWTWKHVWKFFCTEIGCFLFCIIIFSFDFWFYDNFCIFTDEILKSLWTEIRWQIFCAVS